jgi:hypothetical protein
MAMLQSKRSSSDCQHTAEHKMWVVFCWVDIMQRMRQKVIYCRQGGAAAHAVHTAEHNIRLICSTG